MSKTEKGKDPSFLLKVFEKLKSKLYNSNQRRLTIESKSLKIINSIFTTQSQKNLKGILRENAKKGKI